MHTALQNEASVTLSKSASASSLVVLSYISEKEYSLAAILLGDRFKGPGEVEVLPAGIRMLSLFFMSEAVSMLSMEESEALLLGRSIPPLPVLNRLSGMKLLMLAGLLMLMPVAVRDSFCMGLLGNGAGLRSMVLAVPISLFLLSLLNALTELSLLRRRD
jgi:hypothetical protein